jgi:hypothetical protein
LTTCHMPSTTNWWCSGLNSTTFGFGRFAAPASRMVFEEYYRKSRGDYPPGSQLLAKKQQQEGKPGARPGPQAPAGPTVDD